MKILITGGSGLLGQYINILSARRNDILSLYKSNIGNCNRFNSSRVDITNFILLTKIFEDFKPDIVIHTAGFTRPEACTENNKELVYETNVNATENISRLCDIHNAKLIFTSTDLVYKGNSEGMLKEESELLPVSIYAETKIKAEDVIKNIFNNYIILRTSLLIGFGLNHSRNNFHEMYNTLKSGRNPKLFSDQFRTPLSLIDASEIVLELAKSDVNNITLNFGGRERVSRVELGEMLCDIAGFGKNLICRINMSDILDFPAVKDVSLNTEKLQSLGIKQKSLEESIYEIINNSI